VRARGARENFACLNGYVSAYLQRIAHGGGPSVRARGARENFACLNGYVSAY
jgi:hypothetical protein